MSCPREDKAPNLEDPMCSRFRIQAPTGGEAPHRPERPPQLQSPPLPVGRSSIMVRPPALRGRSEFLDTPRLDTPPQPLSLSLPGRAAGATTNFLQLSDVTFLDRWDRPLAPGTFTRAQAANKVVKT